MEREYVIIKHPLRVKGNIFLLGTKFCNGIAVVVKNSKSYRTLLKCPLLRNHKELGIEWLPKLGFRSKDIKLVFGKEVALAFLKMQQKAPQEQTQEEVKTASSEEPTSSKEETVQEETPDEIISEPEVKLEEQTIEEQAQSETPLEPLSLEDAIKAHKEMKLCVAVKPSKEVCKNKISKNSTSGIYCSSHCKQEEQQS